MVARLLQMGQPLTPECLFRELDRVHPGSAERSVEDGPDSTLCLSRFDILGESGSSNLIGRDLPLDLLIESFESPSPSGRDRRGPRHSIM